eukprot:gene12777-16034_t
MAKPMLMPRSGHQGQCLGTVISLPLCSSSRRGAQQQVHALPLSPSILTPLGIGWSLLVHLLAGPVIALAVMSWVRAVIDARAKTERPKVYASATGFNTWVLDRCPILKELYKPTPFLSEGHCESIFANRYMGAPKLSYSREFLHMADGGIVTLDWELDDSLPPTAPLLLMLPGLTQGSESSYICWAVESARRSGIRAVVFNSRGTADSPVTTPQLYSGCYTGDLSAVVTHISKKFPKLLLMAAGWSMGANILVRYLGEKGDGSPIKAAVSLCNPFHLTTTRKYFSTTFSLIYNWGLALAFKSIMAKHEHVWNNAKAVQALGGRSRSTCGGDGGDGIQLKSSQAGECVELCKEWDSVEQYYEQGSSRLSIPDVKVPLLCVQALNDPVSIKDSIPYEAISQNPDCTLVTTKTGGHLGWFAGEGAPWGPRWTDRLVMQWLQSVIQEWEAPGGASEAMKQKSQLSSALKSFPTPEFYEKMKASQKKAKWRDAFDVVMGKKHGEDHVFFRCRSCGIATLEPTNPSQLFSTLCHTGGGCMKSAGSPMSVSNKKTAPTSGAASSTLAGYTVPLAQKNEAIMNLSRFFFKRFVPTYQIEDPDLKKAFSTLGVEPSRKYLNSTLLETEFKHVKNQAEEAMQKTRFFTISSDGWKSKRMEGGQLHSLAV